MTRWLLSPVFALALAVAPAAAQTSTTAKPAPQTQKPATAKPAAPATTKPAPATAKPAPATAKPVAPATPLATAKPYGPGIYAHFTTNLGSFIVRFFDKDAPITVQNFVGLAEGKKAWTDPRTERPVRRPYYNNTMFHRIIPKFMIQGGDPEGTGHGRAGLQVQRRDQP